MRFNFCSFFEGIGELFPSANSGFLFAPEISTLLPMKSIILAGGAGSRLHPLRAGRGATFPASRRTRIFIAGA
jgi:hypothetical protein